MRPSLGRMRCLKISLLGITSLLLVTVANGEAPPSCDRLVDALARNPDHGQVADDLDTTQARISACVRLAEVRSKTAERRARLHRDRAARGLDQ